MLEADVRISRGDFRLDARFTAPTPGVIALFGRSGCGKSTLVNLMAGLLGGGDGRITLDGEAWLDTGRGIRVPAELRGAGVVFQDARLFPHFSVRGNLEYGARRAAGRGASGFPGFDEVVALLGLEPLLPRRPWSLSGGERQRVALGRALLARPRLLLLDEPLASLDAARREEVLPYLERMRDQLSIPMVLVSHQYDEVLRLATHLLVMDAGRVVASGDVGEVSLHPALRGIVGPDALGAVLEGSVVSVQPDVGLAEVVLGNGDAHPGEDRLRVAAQGLHAGQRLRVQLLARDLILAVEEPRGLSVRNQLRGRIRSIEIESGGDLLRIDVGGHDVLARITGSATRELNLAAGRQVWVLVKAVQLGPHALGVGPERNP